jgi:isochorismate pyruvate lyase
MKAMSDSYSVNDIAEARAKIDGINEQIIRLIAERQQWVAAVGKLKKDEGAVHAPDRVEQEIRKVRQLATDFGASPDVVEATFRAMIAAFTDFELDVHRNAAGQSQQLQV